jgi:glutamate-1-semialdehyde 2,1-aminomutase|tara:strand:- start:2316 stop:4343 length:2028 start_codon:yes stop_codon:yes gene_type:complete
MKVVAIVQARMGSTRLPNKIMKLIENIPMIEILLKRLSKSKKIDQIVVATSTNFANLPLIKHVENLGFSCIQGSENDVLGRYIYAAEESQAEIVVRITGDCPLIDSALVDKCIKSFLDKKVDYLCNTNPPSYPDGLDISVVTIKALKQAAKKTINKYDREHVVPYIINSGEFNLGLLKNEEDLSTLRWTVDDPEDFEVISNIFKYFSPNIYFGWKKVLTLYKKDKDLFNANSKIKRNEGSKMITGQKLWSRAKRVIAGGNMLLSKRPEMFLPKNWPVYFSKTKGCKVWDLDGNEFIDMSIMGIGTNTLGYSHPEVDAAVTNTIQNGNMSTLNCPEEVYLSEKLIEIHPWADMVRLARTGGETNAIAIRIARAASGRDKVAVCGYHGWHDWYLSANLGDNKSLDGHLIPGLEPNGVPRFLKDSVYTFNYNRFDELENLVKTHKIGVIKMEVVRDIEPTDNFLKKVRQLADDKGIVLIFDECTSGFRETFGGLHKKYGVEPDMATFGKALGNGYAITAVIGRREIMEAAQSTFISSTFWTERIGPSAALKTLEVMEREKSWEKITQIGNEISKIWKKLAHKHNLPLAIFGIPSLIKMKFEPDKNLLYKTLVTQEMLKRGYLVGNSVYTCTEHTYDILKDYEATLDEVFSMIAKCEKNQSVEELLDGPVCHSDFRRLN